MWKLKYNSGYSLFFEYANSNSYFRSPYDVFVNDQLVIKENTSNTFSIYSKNLETLEIKIVSETVEYQQTIILEDNNYYIDVSNWLRAEDYDYDITSKLQALILSTPDNSTLYFPKATYKITSLFLRSNIKLVFEEDAEFEVTTSRGSFPIIPDIVENKQFTSESCLSTWEGNPQVCLSSVISGYNLENIEIIGKLRINCHANDDNWWNDPKQIKDGWRPKTIYLNNCTNVIIQGLAIYNSPSWSVHPFYCDNISFYDMYINNPKDSPNTDGINPESCRNVEINGCIFNLGDDCIAIKSGKIYMAKKHYQITENIRIVNCKMEHGHGAIVIGSEIGCGVQNLEIENCYFYDTDRGLRVKTRRGRGSKSIINNVVFNNITMDEVRAPITINAFYKCDPDGNSDYVASLEKICEPEDTPVLGNFYFNNLNCENIHQVICMAYGLPEKTIEKIEITNSKFSLSQTTEGGYPLMMRDDEKIQDQLFNILNVNQFIIKNSKFVNFEQQQKTFTNVSVLKEENNEYCK